MHKLINILLLLATITAASQSYTLEKINEVTIEADIFIGIDAFNALYHIKNDVLYKDDVNEGYQFTALQLGAITSVDILNPLKISVFYEATNTAVILDNTLSEITRINFSTIDDFRNISHVTTNGDRRLWVFNTDLQQLEIFDWNTNQITTQFPPMPVNAITVATNYNFAWVVNETGLFHYNNYGSFLSKKDFNDITLISQSDGALILFSQGKLYYKSKESNEFIALKTPDFTIKQLSLNGEILYLYTGQKLAAFRLKFPKKP
ncbi:hypothetical protein DCS32_08220 [Dokdonia sp. Dokd-P16]|uniref:hypothetical protein n=1 Tax=Dokdonia sp. Dokd-P16 TaxID=2173169 RepID=UPI000D548940|nr:hypothetical protein [Dokdonia sp. Dokd-P16]AWH74144.1 hypothetical protein DCS32_08220 [Dokdonia sp. Dokd-P16]